MASMEADARAIDSFRRYLRMKTVHPAPSAGYIEAGALFQAYADELGLKFHTMEFEPGHPVFDLEWTGADPSLPSIVLNSHTDVVPADAEAWVISKDPWSAPIIENKIYGRGAQDMKSVGIQYLEALRRLRAANYEPRRTIHVLFVPDEEVGGLRGMRLLLASSFVKTLNPAFVLDEGLASPTDKYSVFFGERKIWWIRVRATGPTGHGSRFVANTAVDKLLRVVNKLTVFHSTQATALEAACGCGKQLGDFTTCNLTVLKAGILDRYQYNVLPTLAEAGFDCRIPATVDLEEWRTQLAEWCSEDGVSYELVNGA